MLGKAGCDFPEKRVSLGECQVLLPSPPAHPTPSSPAALPGTPLPARGLHTDSHFPMCFNLSRNKASSDTAPPASLVTEGATSPGRQTSAHRERGYGGGSSGQITSMTQFQHQQRAELGESRWDESTGTWGWLWMGTQPLGLGVQRQEPETPRAISETPRAMSLFPRSVSPAGALPGCPAAAIRPTPCGAIDRHQL